MIKEFIEDLKTQGIELNNDMISSFDEFFNDLVERNKITNLTRIVSEKDAYYLHFYDSLMVSKGIENYNTKLLDIGCGPGFPSIPLKIVFNNLDITMIEATNKKVMFVKEEIEKLHLNNIRINHLRAEDFKEFDTYDYVTLRAVASVKELLPFTIPFLKINGTLIIMKGENKGQEELEEAKSLLNKLNSKVDKIIPYKVLDRNYELILIKKIGKTPKGFPKPIHK